MAMQDLQPAAGRRAWSAEVCSTRVRLASACLIGTGVAIACTSAARELISQWHPNDMTSYALLHQLLNYVIAGLAPGAGSVRRTCPSLVRTRLYIEGVDETRRCTSYRTQLVQEKTRYAVDEVSASFEISCFLDIPSRLVGRPVDAPRGGLTGSDAAAMAAAEPAGRTARSVSLWADDDDGENASGDVWEPTAAAVITRPPSSLLSSSSRPASSLLSSSRPANSVLSSASAGPLTVMVGPSSAAMVAGPFSPTLPTGTPAGLAAAAADSEDETVAATDVLGLSYDEDLSENVFLRTLQTKHPRLYAQATEQLCTICVPCASSLEGVTLTLDDFESHILLPPKGSAIDEHRTLSNKLVRVERAYVKTLAAFRTPRRLRILFEETHYNADNLSFRVLCLEGPLEGGAQHDDGAGGFYSTSVQLRSAADCRAYLWGDAQAVEARQGVDGAVAAVRPLLEGPLAPAPDELQAHVAAAYDRALQALLRGLPPRASREPAIKFVRLALETHIMAELHRAIFPALCTAYAREDSVANKVL